MRHLFVFLLKSGTLQDKFKKVVSVSKKSYFWPGIQGCQGSNCASVLILLHNRKNVLSWTWKLTKEVKMPTHVAHTTTNLLKFGWSCCPTKEGKKVPEKRPGKEGLKSQGENVLSYTWMERSYHKVKNGHHANMYSIINFKIHIIGKYVYIHDA